MYFSRLFSLFFDGTIYLTTNVNTDAHERVKENEMTF